MNISEQNRLWFPVSFFVARSKVFGPLALGFVADLLLKKQEVSHKTFRQWTKYSSQEG